MTQIRDYTVHPFRLSDSSRNLLLECERHFQLDRMLENRMQRGEATPEQVRGSAYGVGVQTYLTTGDMERAIFDCWQAYWPQLDNPPKVYQERTINNLIQSKGRLDELRAQYSVAVFHDQPACELSFRLNLDDRWYYVGYIDVVLQNRETGQYGVLEVKTTSARYKDVRPMYQNSGQALGYSIIIDQVAGAEQATFTTPYFVCQDNPSESSVDPTIHIFPFKWTLVDRFKWFATLKLDIERLNMMDSLGIFPQRSKGCLAFGRTCPHFGTCGLTAADKMRAIPEDKNYYQFIYNLEEVIADHVRRIDQ